MTSSLVGSEMCIRDRSRTLCTKQWRYTYNYTSGKFTWEKWEAFPAGNDCCLLYTSDAADDM
eukprot:7621918-Prorocentrum_lima.AAC.1